MSNFASSRSEWEPFGLAARLRGGATAASLALLLAACGHGQNPPSSAPATGTKPPAAAPAPKQAIVPTAPASVAAPMPAATTAQAVADKAVSAAQAKLAAMSVSDLLAAARQAYAQHRLVAPAGDNAMEYYEAVLDKDPNNRVASDALREIFPFGVPDVEKVIAQNNFAEADREIAVLTKADPTNYTLTLLRAKLDAQKKLQARQQQEAQQQAQQAAAEALAAQQAAAAKAAQEEAAAKAAAAAKVAAATRTPPPAAQPVAPPAEPKPAGETRKAKVLTPAAPDYPIAAARNQVSGYAVVEFTVETDGSVASPHVVSSQPRRVFDAAAIQAVRNSKFEPALKDGKPVASTVRRRIDFRFGG